MLDANSRSRTAMAPPALARGASNDQGPPLEPAPDDEALAAHGDAASFTLLYERYVELVYRYVAARLTTREEAEDVTSEAFRRAWASLGAFRASGTFRAWVFRIARRTLADHYRRAQPAAPLAPTLAEHLPDQCLTPEERIEQHEQQRHARQLLASLTAEQQEILCLRFAAELSYADIARVLGKREEAVKKTAYRALEFLRRRHPYDLTDRR